MPKVRDLQLHDLPQLRSSLLTSSHLYPEIDKWWDQKVEPDLRARRRLAYVVDDEGAVQGFVIIKPGRRAKVCSLRVNEAIRRKGWATRLFAHAMKALLEGETQEAYVTISEAAHHSVTTFFEALGFARSAPLRDRYVKGVDEFVYACSLRALARYFRAFYSLLASSAAHDLPANENDRRECPPTRTRSYITMSIKPEFAEMILSGSKRVEFRRRFSTKHIGSLVLFYVPKPVGSFMFKAKIADVDKSPTPSLWSEYSDQGGVGRETFEQYFAGCSMGYALQISDVKPLDNPIGLREAVALSDQLNPPQSFRMLRPQRELAELLHGRAALQGDHLWA